MPTRTEQLISRSVSELIGAVTRLVTTITVQAAARPGAAPAGPAIPKAEKLRESIKAHWASMTPAEHAARVKKMLAGRGLKPKKPPKPLTPKDLAKKAALKSQRLKAAIKSHWAKMSKADRAARVKRMLAGRGLKPTKK